MYKDKENKEINLYKENYLLNNVFIKDIDFQYIYKKTEKIVTAIYLVTNFLDASEPLKWSLRKASTSLLTSSMTFSKVTLSDREVRGHDLNSSILETSSLFDLAYRSGFVSKMNFEIINFEISKLSASVAEYLAAGISSNKSLFDPDYFHVHKDDSDLEKDSQKDNIKDKTKGQYIYKRQNNDLYKTNDIKVDNTNISHNVKKTKKKTNVDRRNIIIAEVKKNGDVSVKDISRALPDLSSKTLQRELLSMVDDGLLVKKGERRWSRYSLKQTL